jgi:hypothetical protein
MQLFEGLPIAEGFVTLEPIQVRIRKAPQLIGEPVTDLFIADGKGELDLFKDDKGHSYLLYSQLKERAAKRKARQEASGKTAPCRRARRLSRAP